MDSQVNLVVKDYYSDKSFCRDDSGNWIKNVAFRDEKPFIVALGEYIYYWIEVLYKHKLIQGKSLIYIKLDGSQDFLTANRVDVFSGIIQNKWFKINIGEMV